MTPKELKRLSRSDLMEMLLDLSKENDDLRARVASMSQELEDRQIRLEKSGTLAEAALQLNGVFDAVQAACEQYKQNVQMRCQKLEEDTRKKCEEMLAAAQTHKADERYAWLKDLMDGEEA